jgi:hypothetical protein
MKSIRSRLTYLENLARRTSSSPTFAIDMTVFLAHPEGPTLLFEFYQAIERAAAKLPPDSDPSLVRQLLLQDARAFEIMPRLAEIAAGLNFESKPKL